MKMNGVKKILNSIILIIVFGTLLSITVGFIIQIYNSAESGWQTFLVMLAYFSVLCVAGYMIKKHIVFFESHQKSIILVISIAYFLLCLLWLTNYKHFPNIDVKFANAFAKSFAEGNNTLSGYNELSKQFLFQDLEYTPLQQYIAMFRWVRNESYVLALFYKIANLIGTSNYDLVIPLMISFINTFVCIPLVFSISKRHNGLCAGYISTILFCTFPPLLINQSQIYYVELIVCIPLLLFEVYEKLIYHETRKRVLCYILFIFVAVLGMFISIINLIPLIAILIHFLLSNGKKLKNAIICTISISTLLLLANGVANIYEKNQPYYDEKLFTGTELPMTVQLFHGLNYESNGVYSASIAIETWGCLVTCGDYVSCPTDYRTQSEKSKCYSELLDKQISNINILDLPSNLYKKTLTYFTTADFGTYQTYKFSFLRNDIARNASDSFLSVEYYEVVCQGIYLTVLLLMIISCGRILKSNESSLLLICILGFILANFVSETMPHRLLSYIPIFLIIASDGISVISELFFKDSKKIKSTDH